MSQQYVATPGGRVTGRIEVPGDKSISHRALMLAAIGEGESRLSGFLRGEDCLATLHALRALGVEIRDEPDGTLVVKGVGMHGLRPAGRALDLGNSGTGMRLMAGLLAPQPFASTLIGDASLMRRPMARVAEPLAEMGAVIRTNDGRPPIEIGPSGALTAIDYRLAVASAQVKSAILLAGLYVDGTTRTVCPGITRDHTERMLAGLGADIDIDSGRCAVSLRGPAHLRAMDWQIPGDFSSAAFFIVAGLLAAHRQLEIANVGLNPTRIGLLHVLRAMGGRIDVVNERTIGGEPVADLQVHRSELHGIDVPEQHVASAIDEFPVLFVAAAAGQGTTRLRGAAELRHKESDRLAGMAAALRGVGVAVEEYPDGLDVVGSGIAGGTVDSCGDHRIAMAMSVAALRASRPIRILDTAAVATSFPDFPATARSVGLGVTAESPEP